MLLRFFMDWGVRRAACAGLAAAWLAAAPAGAQDAGGAIPDVPTLMAQVRAHQRQMEKVQENYTFQEEDVTQTLNKDGSVKKTESETWEVFFVNTHEVQRLMAKDGKALDAEAQQKEQQRVMKAIEGAQKTAPGQAPPGEHVISVGNILAMAKVSSPQRVMLDGRPTLRFDFAGDPHAKAHGLEEEAARKVSGTVWIDEQDREVRRMVAQLDENFHAGFGMLSLSKGSHLVFDQKLVNNEVWLPTGAELSLTAHAFAVIGARIHVQVTDSDYKKFQAKAIQQAGATVVPPQ